MTLVFTAGVPPFTNVSAVPVFALIGTAAPSPMVLPVVKPLVPYTT